MFERAAFLVLPVFSRPSVTIVDCGASRVALGVFRAKGERLHCSYLAVEPLPAVSKGDNSWLAATATAMRTLNAAGTWSGPVMLVLPPHLMLTKSIKVPRVESARLEEIIRFEAEQCIPNALSDVVWDRVGSGSSEQELEFMLVAIKRKILNDLCEITQAAGFTPRRIIPATLSTLASHDPRLSASRQPSLLLNIGARSTVVLQIAGKRFAARTLAIGGDSVSEHIAEKQACGIKEAERIKHLSSNPGLVAAATEALAARLAQEVRLSVLHFGRQGGLGKPEQAFLAGGGARLAGLREVLAPKLKIPVECAFAVGALDIGTGPAFPDAPPHALTDLIGAAVIELGKQQLTMNLLPPSLARLDRRRRQQPWLWGSAALLAVALLLPILHYQRLSVAAAAIGKALEDESAPLRIRAAHIQAGLTRLEELKAQGSRLHSLHVRRTAWLELFAGLQQHLVRVEDVWLDKIQALPPASSAPLKLLISGRMLDRTNPAAKASPEAYTRVKALLDGLGKLPNISAVEGERFEHSQPGVLKFHFVLVADRAPPL